jgi:hypothetical protein
MTYEEAVTLLTNTLKDILTEDHVQDAMQETVEEIVIEYYGWDPTKWEDATTTEGQLEEEDREIALEDFMWSDIGPIALMRIAAEWAKGRNDLRVSITAELPDNMKTRLVGESKP